MPQKILEREICRQIIDRNRDRLAAQIERSASTMVYDFRRFMTDMCADGFISTRATLGSKWTTLKADGVVVIGQWGATALDIGELYLRAGMPKPFGASARMHAQTHTHTHTDGEGSE